MEIEKIREKIDSIDKQLIDLISERLNYSEKIAEYKKKNNLEIEQPKREEELLQEKKILGKEKNLTPEFAEKLFRELIEESKKRQRESLK